MPKSLRDLASRREKSNCYNLLSRRVRGKTLREYNALSLTRKPRPTILSLLLASVGLVFIYYKVKTEIQVVKSHELLPPLEPIKINITRENNFKEEINKINDLDKHLTLITFNNMTFILNLTQDLFTILVNISKENLTEPIVIQNLDNSGFTSIQDDDTINLVNEIQVIKKQKIFKLDFILDTANSTKVINLDKKAKKWRKKSSLALNYVDFTQHKLPRIRKVNYSKPST